jgi:hypothetical protein
LHANQATLLAEWAEIEALAGELVEEGWPIGWWGGQQEGSGIDVEQLAAADDFLLDVAMGEEAEVADTDEAGGQDVEQEAAEELEGVEREDFFDTAVAVILPAEADTVVFDLEQPMVGDSHAVGIAAEILDDLGRAAKGTLGVDDPAAVGGLVQPAAKGFGMGKAGEIAKERELALLKGFEQSIPEQMAEAGAEDFDGEEEVLAVFLGTATGDPTLAVGR